MSSLTEGLYEAAAQYLRSKGLKVERVTSVDTSGYTDWDELARVDIEISWVEQGNPRGRLWTYENGLDSFLWELDRVCQTS